MSYVVLARKWRPKRFAEMAGQEHVLRALGNALDSGRVHHAFLFTGTRGVGKTTVARILAKSLNCETGVTSNPCGICAACREIDEGRFVDLIEVDAASRTKVDDTRELLDNVQYAPTRGRYKVYLIDEVHMLSNHSFNALLKTLEEPPPHVKFLLATTDPQKLPVTVLSRCLQFSLKRLSANLISERMKVIAQAEGLAYEPAALVLLARAADGSMRDGLSLLDQLVAFGGGSLTEVDTRAMLGTIDRGHVVRIVESLGSGDGAAALAQVRELDRDAPDYDRALSDLAALLQRVAIVQVVPGTAELDEEYEAETLSRLAGALTPEDAQLFYQIALNGRRDLPLAPEPRLGFEMTLLRMLAFRPDSDITAPTSARRPVATAAAAGANAASFTASASEPTLLNVASAAPTAVSTPVASAAAGITSAEPAAPGTPAVKASSAPVDHIDAGNWGALLDAAGVSGMARLFAVNCVPAGFEHDTLRLKLDATAADRRAKATEDKLLQSLSKHFGRDIRIVYEVADAGIDTPARQRASADRERAARAAQAFEEDATVKGLRERFGADVDMSSVKPGN